MSITIKVENCKYYLPYEKGHDYSDEGGDCDHVRGLGRCDYEECPLNLMIELPNLAGINKAIRDAEYIKKCLNMVKEQIKIQSSKESRT